MPSQAERMMALLEGFSGAHGTYASEDKRANSPKSEIKRTARTVREAVTVSLWQQHLDGTRPLGIIPIRADSTCMWGAIDIDDYTLDHAALVKRLAQLEVPSVVCKTKSGGAHIYVFFREPVPASDVMSKLRELSARLDRGGCEVFPKQEEMLLDRGDLGNWLNMPYFGGDKSPRYAVLPDGRGITVDQFLAMGEKLRMGRQQFLSLLPRPVAKGSGGEFSQGPPCLEVLTAEGFPEGTRNNGLMALGVLAKKMHPDDWQTYLDRWNNQYMSPPLSHEEVRSVVRGLEKHQYHYRCKDAPIVSRCDSRTCRMRKYGVGGSETATLVESVQILDTEPPLFFVTVAVGGTVECTSAVLLSSREFQRVCLEQLRKVVPLYKNDDWLPQVHRAIEEATMIEAPRDASVAGQFEELLQQFLVDRHTSTVRDDILLGRPWYDETTRRYYFRLSDLQNHLHRYHFDEYSRVQLGARIRQAGGEGKFFVMKGRGVNTWYVPEKLVQRQMEAHEVPPVAETPI